MVLLFERGSSMRVLVTGAGGFLGSALIRRLSADGHFVRAFMRRKETAFNLHGTSAEIFIGNILDKESVKEAVSGMDYVFHAAAIFRGYPFYIKRPKDIFETNIYGVRNICEAALAAGVKRVIYTSSTAAVGKRADGRPADETEELNHLESRSFYELSKFEAEKVALSYHAKGLNIISLNPSFLFGVRDSRPTPTGEMVVKFLNRVYPCYFNAKLCVSDIDSTVNAHVAAMNRGESGKRYIVAHEQRYTLEELFRMLEEISGVSAPRLKLPAGMVMAFAIMNEAVLGMLRLSGKILPIIEFEVVRYFMLDAQYESALAHKELDFKHGDFRKVLEEEVLWYIKNGYVKRSSKIKFYRKIGRLKS